MPAVCCNGSSSTAVTAQSCWRSSRISWFQASWPLHPSGRSLDLGAWNQGEQLQRLVKDPYSSNVSAPEHWDSAEARTCSLAPWPWPCRLQVIRTLVVCGSVENARIAPWKQQRGPCQRGRKPCCQPQCTQFSEVMRLLSEDVMKYSRNRHASLVHLPAKQPHVVVRVPQKPAARKSAERHVARDLQPS